MLLIFFSGVGAALLQQTFLDIFLKPLTKSSVLSGDIARCFKAAVVAGRLALDITICHTTVPECLSLDLRRQGKQFLNTQWLSSRR